MDIKALVNKINDTIAVKATQWIGTMWCVYFFIVFALTPLVIPSTNTAIQYISSAFLQLVFLPLIMVGSAALSKASEDRAKEDHEMLMAELAEIKAMHAELHLALNLDKTDDTPVEIEAA